MANPQRALATRIHALWIVYRLSAWNDERTSTFWDTMASILRSYTELRTLALHSEYTFWVTKPVLDMLLDCNSLTKLKLTNTMPITEDGGILHSIRNLCATIQSYHLGGFHYAPFHIFDLIENFTPTLRIASFFDCNLPHFTEAGQKWPNVHTLVVSSCKIHAHSVQVAFPNVRCLETVKITYSRL